MNRNKMGYKGEEVMKTLQEILTTECGYTDEEISSGIGNSWRYKLKKFPLKTSIDNFKHIKVIEYKIKYSENEIGKYYSITLMFIYRGNPNYGRLSFNRMNNGKFDFYFYESDYVHYLDVLTRPGLVGRVESYSRKEVTIKRWRGTSFGRHTYKINGYMMTQEEMNNYTDMIAKTIPFSNKNKHSTKEVVFVGLTFKISNREEKELFFNKEENTVLGVMGKPIFFFISKGKNGKYIIDRVNFNRDNGKACTTLTSEDFINIYENKRLTWDELFTPYNPKEYSNHFFISRDVPEEILNEIKSDYMLARL